MELEPDGKGSVEWDEKSEGQGPEVAVKLIIQPEAGVVPIVKAIQTAPGRRSTSFIFRFDRDEIEKALATAVQRGVTVRALIAHTNRGGEARLRKLEQRLLAAGVLVSRTADDLMRYHAKYMIGDAHAAPAWLQFHQARHRQEPQLRHLDERHARPCRKPPKLFEADVTRQPYTPAQVATWWSVPRTRARC